MKDEKGLISAGIARSAHSSQIVKDHAHRGLILFMHEQIADAEWKITRARAEIEAYETAIKAIESNWKPIRSDSKGE